jgi:hypothetical protein
MRKEEERAGSIQGVPKVLTLLKEAVSLGRVRHFRAPCKNAGIIAGVIHFFSPEGHIYYLLIY